MLTSFGSTSRHTDFSGDLVSWPYRCDFNNMLTSNSRLEGTVYHFLGALPATIWQYLGWSEATWGFDRQGVECPQRCWSKRGEIENWSLERRKSRRASSILQRADNTSTPIYHDMAKIWPFKPAFNYGQDLVRGFEVPRHSKRYLYSTYQFALCVGTQQWHMMASTGL